MIEFVNNSWWPLSIAGLCIILICWIWSEKKRRQTLNLLLNEDMASKLSSSACSLKRLWRNILYTGALCFLLFALLRPYSGVDTEERQQSTRDIMVLFDISNSMNVIDAHGDSRLKYGKSLVTKLINSLPGDRFGLMSFAGLAFLECPMTSDSYSFDAALNDMNSDKIPLGGTNIEIALNQVLSEYHEGAPHKAIVLISDGEEIGGDYSTATQKMKEKGIKVITVQIGDETKAGSVRNSQGRVLRDQSGQLLTSQADSKTLKDIADKTGGIYLGFDAASYSDSQLKQIISHIKSMNTGEGEKEIIQKPREIYQPFLLAAVLLLMARMLIGERKKIATSIATISVLFLSFSIHGQLPTTKEPPPHKLPLKQHKKYNQLQNEEIDLIAQTKNKKIKADLQFLAWYNLGLNLSQQHAIMPTPEQEVTDNEEKEPTLFDRASQAYITASSIPQGNLTLQVAAIHNRASLFHQEAKKIYLEEPEKAIDYLKEAQSSYRQALALQNGSQKSARNLELSYLHLKEAELAKEMLKHHEEALRYCGESLLGVRALKKHTILIEKFGESLKSTFNATKLAKVKASELESENHEQAYGQVIELIQQASQEISHILSDDDLFTKTEEKIAQAYKILGGNPDKPEEQQQNNQNQEQQKQNQQDQNQEQQKQNQKEGNPEENKQEKEKENEKSPEQLDADKQQGDFEKSQQQANKEQQKQQLENAKIREAEALLRKMGDTEKKVREHIRQQQAKDMEEQLREKGIYIAPESNK